MLPLHDLWKHQRLLIAVNIHTTPPPTTYLFSSSSFVVVLEERSLKLRMLRYARCVMQVEAESPFEMVDYAGICATTHPRRGRPSAQPWSGRRPVGRKNGKSRRVA